MRFRPGIRAAYWVSLFSLLFTVAASVAGLALAISSASSATLGFALESGVDALSSGLILWRFWGGGDVLPECALAARELHAQVAISILFVSLGLVVGLFSLNQLQQGHVQQHLETLARLSGPTASVFLMLGWLKIYIGRRIWSEALVKDGAASLGGCVLSLGVLLGAAAAKATPMLWFVDGAVALVVAAALLGYGAHALTEVEGSWWRPSFWRAPMTIGMEPIPGEGEMANLALSMSR